MTETNSQSPQIIPWAFVITVESTSKIEAHEVLETIRPLSQREGVLYVSVEAIGPIKVGSES